MNFPWEVVFSARGELFLIRGRGRRCLGGRGGGRSWGYLVKALSSINQPVPYKAGPRSAVSSTSHSRARGPGLDTQSGHILSFLLPLIQEGQLSVTGECMCMKNWLTA